MKKVVIKLAKTFRTIYELSAKEVKALANVSSLSELEDDTYALAILEENLKHIAKKMAKAYEQPITILNDFSEELMTIE